MLWLLDVGVAICFDLLVENTSSKVQNVITGTAHGCDPSFIRLVLIHQAQEFLLVKGIFQIPAGFVIECGDICTELPECSAEFALALEDNPALTSRLWERSSSSAHGTIKS